MAGPDHPNGKYVPKAWRRTTGRDRLRDAKSARDPLGPPSINNRSADLSANVIVLKASPRDRVYREINDGRRGSRPLASTRITSSAITCSSSVAMTKAAIRLDPLLVLSALLSFAQASISKPSQASRSHTMARICGWFSPIPAVNTIASTPPSVTARANSPLMRNVNISIACRACGRFAPSCKPTAISNG